MSIIDSGLGDRFILEYTGSRPEEQDVPELGVDEGEEEFESDYDQKFATGPLPSEISTEIPDASEPDILSFQTYPEMTGEVSHHFIL